MSITSTLVKFLTLSAVLLFLYTSIISFLPVEYATFTVADLNASLVSLLSLFQGVMVFLNVFIDLHFLGIALAVFFFLMKVAILIKLGQYVAQLVAIASS